MHTTTGQQFAAALRTSFRINGKSRDRRDGGSIKADMLESVENAVQFEGYYGPERTELSRAAFGAVQSHRKHVEGYRIDGMVAYEISKLTPYQFAGYLGAMIDAGVTNCGQGEVYYARMRQAVAA